MNKLVMLFVLVMLTPIVSFGCDNPCDCMDRVPGGHYWLEKQCEEEAQELRLRAKYSKVQDQLREINFELKLKAQELAQREKELNKREQALLQKEEKVK